MNKSMISRILTYLVFPVAFCAVGYLVLFLALRPVWDLASTGVSLLSTDNAPVFNRELTSMFDPDAAPVEVVEDEPGEPYIPIADVELPGTGVHYANLICDRLEMNVPVYWYDDNEILRNGAGQYIASSWPGFGSLLVISAHNTSFFRPLKDAAVGDVYRIDTNWGSYEYETTDTLIMTEKELAKYIGAHLLEENNEVLLLYTCYPFDFSTAHKMDRFVVLAKRISGIDVKWRVDE